MRTVAFFTEMRFGGKIPTNHSNMRTEFAWMALLDAEHHPIPNFYQPSFEGKYDIGIIIIPKNNPQRVWEGLEFIRRYCTNIFLMQEGPNWHWQDWKLVDQIQYVNLLSNDLITGLLCHNKADLNYYRGLSNKPVFVLPTAMVPDSLGKHNRLLEISKRSNTMIGGSMVSWYGGMDSLMVAQEIGEPVFVPAMGRMKDEEFHFEAINVLPYTDWVGWMEHLADFKYAIHLMRTHAAGTFALNCAYYGIPCIGYKGLDTQEMCHPGLSVDLGDLKYAKYLARLLKEDDQFYAHQSAIARKNYDDHFSPQIFLDSEFVQTFINK